MLAGYASCWHRFGNEIQVNIMQDRGACLPKDRTTEVGWGVQVYAENFLGTVGLSQGFSICFDNSAYEGACLDCNLCAALCAGQPAGQESALVDNDSKIRSCSDISGGFADETAIHGQGCSTTSRQFRKALAWDGILNPSVLSLGF